MRHLEEVCCYVPVQITENSNWNVNPKGRTHFA